MGALYIEQGYPTIKAWIKPLVLPEIYSNDSTGSSAVNPPPPSTPPPPLPGNTLGSGAILALFNQTASQRGVKIEWKAIQSGPGHQLTWNVDCIGKTVLLLSGNAEYLSCSGWNNERPRGRKKQAAGERGGCATSLSSHGMG